MTRNILNFDEFMQDVSLNEGLLMTYPADRVVKYIWNKLHLDKDDINVLIDDGVYIIVEDKLEQNILDDIDKILKLGGYYMANQEDGAFFYERKFEEDIFDELKKSGNIDYFYHLTPSINDKKIQKLGLIPKSKNYRYNYPDRIYLLLNNEPNFLYRMCKTLYDPIYFRLKMMVLKNKIDKDIFDRKRIKEYSVYRIDFSKVENIKLYKDPNARDFDSYFTMDNIRPEWIEKIDEIKL